MSLLTHADDDVVAIVDHEIRARRRVQVTVEVGIAGYEDRSQERSEHEEA